MSSQTWEELIYTLIADTTQVSNTVTETIMVPDFGLPAKFWYPNRTLRVTLLGAMSNVITTPGTLILRSRLGGVAGTVLAASPALALNVAAQTASNIAIEFWHTCRATGNSVTSGALFTHGRIFLGNSRSTQGLSDMAPASGNVVVSAIDLTSPTTLTYTAQFSVATAPTNLLINSAHYEVMN